MHDLIYKDGVAFAGNLADDCSSNGFWQVCLWRNGQWFIPSIQAAGVDLGIALPGLLMEHERCPCCILSITKDCVDVDAAWSSLVLYFLRERQENDWDRDACTGIVAQDIGYLMMS